MSIVDDAKALVAKIESEFSPVEAEIKSDALTIEQQIIAMGYPMIIQDALALITGALTNTGWSTLVATLIKTAENQGHTIVAAAADSALNLAKAQLVVTGTVAPTTPAA